MTEDFGGDLGAGVELFGLVSAAAVVSRHAAQVERELGRARDVPDPETLLAGLAALFARYRAKPVESYVEFPPVRPGETVAASLWIHNPADNPSGPVSVRAGGFVSAGGDEIPPQMLVPEPAELDAVAPGGSAEIVWRLSVPPNQPGGRYHGLLFASIVPDAPAVARVRVEP